MTGEKRIRGWVASPIDDLIWRKGPYLLMRIVDFWTLIDTSAEPPIVLGRKPDWKTRHRPARSPITGIRWANERLNLLDYADGDIRWALNHLERRWLEELPALEARHAEREARHAGVSVDGE